MLTSLEARAPALPFRFGSPADYTELRALLERHGYRELIVHDRLAALERAESRGGAMPAGRHDDAIGILLDLFHGLPVPRRAIDARLDACERELLESLALVADDESDPALARGTVLLYPTRGFYIISDVNHDADNGVVPPPDVVYPAITSNTVQFLELLPIGRCERFLELCAGTGIGALVGSRLADHAWAVDITERATRFARFNAELNDVGNITVLRGDLYAPVRGRTFDRIVAHPPHVPSPRRDYIFRDGGVDGEEITRGILMGLPDHLEPGGRFYCACMMTDRRDAPVEQRVRTMLGDCAGEFDVVVLQRWAMHPSEYHARSAFAGRLAPVEARDRTIALDRMGVERLVYGMLVLQRRKTARPVFTARHQLAQASSADTVDWLLHRRLTMLDPVFDRGLLDARPFRTPGVEAHIVHRATDDRWGRDGCTVAMRAPFVAARECPCWTLELLARCDGKLTLRDHLRLLHDDATTSPGASRDDMDDCSADGAEPSPTAEALQALTRTLLEAGFLQLASCPIPRASPID